MTRLRRWWLGLSDTTKVVLVLVPLFLAAMTVGIVLGVRSGTIDLGPIPTYPAWTTTQGGSPWPASTSNRTSPPAPRPSPTHGIGIRTATGTPSTRSKASPTTTGTATTTPSTTTTSASTAMTQPPTSLLPRRTGTTATVTTAEQVPTTTEARP